MQILRLGIIRRKIYIQKMGSRYIMQFVNTITGCKKLLLNIVYIKTHGDMIYVICNEEEQLDDVNKRFYGSGNELIGYEEWDEGKDKKWIMTWKVPDGFDRPVEYN